MANRFDLVNLSNILQTSANGTVANVNFDANTLFIDGVNNRVGIGTNAPSASLQTVGDVVIANNLSFNSGYGSVATAYGCRAWVNFNGTGTVAIRGSGNVTSITDNGVGDYTVNFTNAMPDANYAYSHAYSNEWDVAHTVGFLSSYSTTALRVAHYNVTNSTQTTDKANVFIAVFR